MVVATIPGEGAFMKNSVTRGFTAALRRVNRSISCMARRRRKPDSNFWALNHANSVVLTAGTTAEHICHVCLRRTHRINPARDSAIASGQPPAERRSTPDLTPGAADAHFDHRLEPAPLPHAAG